MASISIETKRIDELSAATEATNNDLMLVRASDGTGTKNIKFSDVKKSVIGDMDDLEFEAGSVVAALNKVKPKDLVDISYTHRISANSYVVYKRYGNYVVCDAHIQAADIGVPAGQWFGKMFDNAIPKGYRPHTNTEFVLGSVDRVSTLGASMQFQTGGAIRFNTRCGYIADVDAAAYVCVHTVWFTNETI